MSFRRLCWVCFALLFVLGLPAVKAEEICLADHEEAREVFAEDTVSCGFITLPQDYSDPSRGDLALFYTRIHSRSATPQPDPLVYLVGGPGSGASWVLPFSFEKYLHAFADERDIIVIDQRGTGRSEPSLYCYEVGYRIDDILQSRQKDRADLMLEVLEECQTRLAYTGTIQFDTFHSISSARDITEALLKLGYERWNLVGVSYGSRLALAMMRDHPQHLRSVILDSVYPPQGDIYLDAYHSGERALQKLFDACAASEACRQRFPNSDLEATFYDLYHRLNKSPVIDKFWCSSLPTSHQPLTIEISGYRLYAWVFSWLYEVQTAIPSIPLWIDRANNGDWQDPVCRGIEFEWQMLLASSLGMHYTVQCQEEYISAPSRNYPALITEYPHLSGYLNYPVEGARTLPRLCALWQAQPAPPIANAPVESDVPALLLSGGFDPITPPAYAQQAAQTLSSTHRFELPQAAHGVLRSDACALQIAREFIRAPLDEPDGSCIPTTPAIEFK